MQILRGTSWLRQCRHNKYEIWSELEDKLITLTHFSPWLTCSQWPSDTNIPTYAGTLEKQQHTVYSSQQLCISRCSHFKLQVFILSFPMIKLHFINPSIANFTGTPTKSCSSIQDIKAVNWQWGYVNFKPLLCTTASTLQSSKTSFNNNFQRFNR